MRLGRAHAKASAHLGVVREAVRERVGAYRHRMRARGYRPVQAWVPDVRSEQFVREARRQAALIAQTDRQTDDQDFIESVSLDWDEE